MDTSAILSKLNRTRPGLVLEKSRFGRSRLSVLWIDSRNLLLVGQGLRADPELQLDWLENLSVARLGDALVFTYVVRSTTSTDQILLRCALEIGAETDAHRIRIFSLRGIWPMAGPMEDREAELFGLDFVSSDGIPLQTVAGLLPHGDTSFPMRKAWT